MENPDMSKKAKESFYEKHFFIIWGIAGYLGTLVVALMRGASFVKDTDYLLFVTLLIASPVLGIFWYSLFVLTNFVISVFWSGITEKDPMSIFGAFWLTIGLLSFIANTLF